jgi:hypothetical protein
MVVLLKITLQVALIAFVINIIASVVVKIVEEVEAVVSVDAELGTYA